MSAVPIEQPSTPLGYALAYARRGWHVLPLEPHTKRPHRFARNGVYSATTDAEQIRRWWEEVPEAGIGVSMGASGLCAFDIDPRNNGLLTLEALESRYGRIESDVTAFTPGGGMHLVFTAPPSGVSMPATLGPGIDIKFVGYICVEPSVHPNGKQYVWEASSSPLEGAVPSPLPEWIRDFVTVRRDTPHGKDEKFVPIGEETWVDIAGALKKIDSDGRDTWIKVGMALRSTGEEQRAFDAWDGWSRSSAKYNAADQMRVWRSFRARGLDGVTYRSIFAMAQPDKPAPADPGDDLLLNVLELAERSRRLSWSVKHVIPEASVGMIFGASGTFKSFIALDYALHKCYALPWMGQKTKPGLAVYLAAEGGLGLFRRIRAWHVERKMDWQKCPLMVCIVPLTINTQAATLKERILAVCPSVTDVILDTLSQTYVGNENAADEMSEYFRAIGTELRAALGATVTIIHHTGHSATERPRGSSAIVANLDFVIGVFRDEKALSATVCFIKQKDGELLKDQDFRLLPHQVDTDEDGEPVTSLVARHMTDGAEIANHLIAEKKAGRSSHLTALLDVAQDGMLESEMRSAFYKSLPDAAQQETKKKAFQRALDKAIKAGFLVIDQAAGNLVRTNKPVDNFDPKCPDAGHENTPNGT